MVMTNIQKDKSIFDCPTCPEEQYGGCIYMEQGRCIYNIATIQVRVSRACYSEELQAYYDAQADYELGLM